MLSKLTETVIRSTLKIFICLGSGDYNEDYYDDYEYEDEDNLGDIEKVPPTSRESVSSPPTTTVITTTTVKSITETTTHPHRHHHGEINPSDTVRFIEIIFHFLYTLYTKMYINIFKTNYPPQNSTVFQEYH